MYQYQKIVVQVPDVYEVLCVHVIMSRRSLGSQTISMSGGKKDKLMSLPAPLIHLPNSNKFKP